MRFNRLVILSFLAACKAAAPTSSATYSEDLSVHRPVSSIPGDDTSAPSEVMTEQYKPMTGHIKAELDSIARIAYIKNKEGKYVDGFVIQVYSGSSRDDANAAQTKMNTLFTELDPKISYHQPNFRVKGGRFTNRLEAHRIYSLVKEEFPRAILLPERFKVTYE